MTAWNPVEGDFLCTQVLVGIAQTSLLIRTVHYRPPEVVFCLKKKKTLKLIHIIQLDSFKICVLFTMEILTCIFCLFVGLYSFFCLFVSWDCILEIWSQMFLIQAVSSTDYSTYFFNCTHF